jgi:hypothetical protein
VETVRLIFVNARTVLRRNTSTNGVFVGLTIGLAPVSEGIAAT